MDKQTPQNFSSDDWAWAAKKVGALSATFHETVAIQIFLKKVEKKHGAEGFVIIGVSVDESGKEMDRFKSKNPVSFVLVHDAKMKLVTAVDAPTMPTSFLIGKDGKVIQRHAGFKGKETEDALEKEIAAALAK